MQSRMHIVLTFGVFALALPAAAHSAPIADTVPLRVADADRAKKPIDVKNTFRNICGFCHEDYGRRQGKGPQLMNDPNTDEFLFNRIKHGKPGRMAAWGSVFTDDQIWQIVKFIRNLKPDQEPQNP